MTENFTNKIANAFEEMANNQKEFAAIAEFLENEFPEEWGYVSRDKPVCDTVIELLGRYKQIAYMPQDQTSDRVAGLLMAKLATITCGKIQTKCRPTGINHD